VTDFSTDCPTLEDLGVQLTDFATRLRYEIRPYVTHNVIEHMKGEFGVAEHLTTVSSV